MKRLFDGFFRKSGLIKDAAQRNVVSRVVSVAANGAIGFTLLGTLGIDTSPLLAAAGITGATIGFACRDYGANIVAGIALVGQPCFRMGKRVNVGVGTNRVAGVIDHWDIRYLYLRGDRGELIMVPNNVVLNSIVSLDKPKQEDIEATWANSTPEPAAVAAAAASTPPRTTEDKMWAAAAEKVACRKKEEEEKSP